MKLQFLEDGPKGYYFEDFEIGMKVATRGRTITESDIVQFAGLTGDYNPMHTDAHYAENSFMGKRVAHGLLTLSYAVGLAYQLGILERTVLAFRELEMKFSVPVTIGDTIRAELTVESKAEARRLGGGTVVFAIRIYNHEDKVVQKGTMNLLMASRPQES